MRLHPSGSHWEIGSWGQCPLWVTSGHMQCKKACPLYPRKRTCAAHKPMSAKCQKRTSSNYQLAPQYTPINFNPATIRTSPRALSIIGGRHWIPNVVPRIAPSVTAMPYTHKSGGNAFTIATLPSNPATELQRIKTAATPEAVRVSDHPRNSKIGERKMPGRRDVPFTPESGRNSRHRTLIMLVGPGEVPPHSDFNNLQCQTSLTASRRLKTFFCAIKPDNHTLVVRNVRSTRLHTRHRTHLHVQ